MNTWIKNMKISAKLFFMSGVAIVGMVIIALCSFTLMGRMNRDTADIVGSWLTGINESRAVDTYISDFHLNELRYITADTESKRSMADTEMNALKSRIQEAVDRYTASVDPDETEDIGYINAVTSRWNEYLTVHNRMIDAANKGDYDAAMEILDNEAMTAYNAMTKALDTLTDYNSTGAYEAGENSALLYRVSVVISIVLVVMVITFGLMVAAAVAKSIHRPVEEIKNAAVKMAQGNLDIQLDYNSQDELGVLSAQMKELVRKLKAIIDDENAFLAKLAASDYTVESVCPGEYTGGFYPLLVSFNKIADKMNENFYQIGTSAEQVSNGAEQVANGAQALAQGSTEQASSVEELSSSINSISQQVNTNAEVARTASLKANEVGEGMQVSNKKMEEMMEAMTDISGSSREIGKIIKTIEDIAFQTNILALNAAVEAARAGAAGKGFAVVANEVRNLASKSAEASQNTSALIERSIKAVENGTRIADETAKSLLQAVEGAKEATRIINQISEASEHQAKAINQVTIGIEQISSVVQSNSATSEQSAAASEELSSQAQVLKRLVSTVRLRSSQNMIGAGSYGEPVAEEDSNVDYSKY
ncbi:MAG: HAMP domain-containing protein [Lachnospiraceae bacterium]|nr:HAMP domain-containing protein [Lachnospiraceae bacterium]